MKADAAEVIVVGLGAIGSAILYQLARAGVPALGIDRFAPPHDRGSSHGDSRITRQAVGEGSTFAPLVLRSHRIWRELEQETGETLLLQVGGLVMAPQGGAARHHGSADFVQGSAAVARRFAIPHEVLDADEVIRRFPQFRLRGDEVAFYEPGAGVLRPERCVAAQLAAAARRGARIRTGEVVRSVQPDGAGVTVTTDQGCHRAARAVLAAGAWMPTLLSHPLGGRLTVTRQTLHWFKADPVAWAAERTPVFIWMHGEREEDYMYGFPVLPGTEGVKVASEQYAFETTAERVDRTVPPAESQAIYDAHVAGRLLGVGPIRLRAAACLYTVTPDRSFLVDRHPEHAAITLVSACSGHAFKHSAGLGEAVARAIVHGESTVDLSSFHARRLLATGAKAEGSSATPQG